MSMPSEVVKAKVCLVGEAGVGKTCLVRRFVYNTYADQYIPTLGAKVTKKEVDLRAAGRDAHVVLTIWDVMGERTFLPMLEEAWLARAQGVLAVADLSRPASFRAMIPWIDAVRRVSGPVPILLLGNKADLISAGSDPHLSDIESVTGLPGWITSAKTGLNVEAAFRALAEHIVRASLPRHEGVMRSRPEPAEPAHR